jgi:hypothetical protein
MTYEEYKAKTVEMVNEVSDLCMTSYVTDQMSLDEVIAYYQNLVGRIYMVCSYPDNPPPPPPSA